MVVSKVGRRGQITLPLAVRNPLNLKEGDHIAFVQKGDEVILQPLTKRLLDLRGTVAVSGPQDFSAIRERVIEAHSQEIAQDGCRSRG